MYDGRVKTGGGGRDKCPPTLAASYEDTGAGKKREEKLAIHFLPVGRGISKRGHSPPNTPQPPKDENVSRNERIEEKQGLWAIDKSIGGKGRSKSCFLISSGAR